MTRQFANIVVLLGLILAAATITARRTPARVSSAPESAELAALEDAAARAPGDTEAVRALVRGYIERDEPGLAVAALQRSPAAAVESPAATDLAAIAYLNAGLGTAALSMSRRTLLLCEKQGCEQALRTRASRRVSLIETVLEMGVEDVYANPDAFELAYRRTVRHVRVAVND